MLNEYIKKRNFKRTSEPRGKEVKNNKVHNFSFVIQKHHASHLHYDFRLEIQGVLKSWAIPKGIPESINIKHLAVETEDHPLEYASFEGNIPKGEYGGGKVEIWDKGCYENITYGKDKKLKPIEDALKDGHILFILQGNNLKNEHFLLQKLKKTNTKNWLLMKTERK